MFDEEAKELTSAFRSLQFLEKLPPSARRDKLIEEIQAWFDLNDRNFNHGVFKTLPDLQGWVMFLEQWVERHGGNIPVLLNQHKNSD